MSDFLLIRGLDVAELRPLLDAWKKPHKWVRSVDVHTRWEPQQLEINGRDAGAYMKGKHRAELAELILLLSENGGRVIHLMLHRSQAERIEEDLLDWARREAGS
jgi:hypothetical protein